MKLNKHKRPYIEPDEPKPCRIIDKNGLVYHPTSAPVGFCKCGVMLELKPKTKDYIFSARIRANHARAHTIKWLEDNNFPVDFDDFIIQYV
jgi:hypothetical protein